LANKDIIRKKVYVGMSGGVDSSVSAFLLKQAGYDVTGVFIRVWQPEGSACTWKDERRDAMRVAAHLGIPFVTLDLRDAYKKGVVDYMIREYKEGHIPNPDVMCNREVKFGAFYTWAKDMGADYIATGHYARTRDGQLYEGHDTNKDQSYFLWTLTQDELTHVLFPIGHLDKKEVRSIGEKAGIPVFDKKDSQGVCFIGHIDMKEFLKEYIDTQEGDVLDIQGNKIGTHQGALLYTNGERHAFHLFTQSNEQKRLYVIDKDVQKNTITVGELEDLQKHNTASQATGVTLKDTVLRISQEDLQTHVREKKVTCRTRYRQEKVQVESMSTLDKTLTLTLVNQPVVSAGQSVVLYVDDLCVGGGVLE
jgi:tRNA-uridine 2-sulfurtransferase